MKVKFLISRKKIELEKYNTGRLGLFFLIEAENLIINENIKTYTVIF